jgi:hypothetical protein
MYLYLDGEHPNFKKSRIEAKSKRDKQAREGKRIKSTDADFKRRPKHTKAFLETAVSGAYLD